MLFGIRIAGSSNDNTSSGPGIGFLVVLEPLDVLEASRAGPLDEYWTRRAVVKTRLGSPFSSAVTRNTPVICTLTGPAGVSSANGENAKSAACCT